MAIHPLAFLHICRKHVRIGLQHCSVHLQLIETTAMSEPRACCSCYCIPVEKMQQPCAIVLAEGFIA